MARQFVDIPRILKRSQSGEKLFMWSKVVRIAVTLQSFGKAEKWWFSKGNFLFQEFLVGEIL